MVKAQVLAEIRKAMAQLAYFQEVSEILRSAIENNSSNMKAAQRRISAGLASVGQVTSISGAFLSVS